MQNKQSLSVLITGPTGFVGSNLYRQFKSDFQLIGLSRSNVPPIPKTMGANDETWPPRDLHSYNKLNDLPRTDAIVHLAGLAHDIGGRTPEKEYFEANVDLTRRIFDYFLNSESNTFIFFSSIQAVTDVMQGNEPLSETHRPAPRTPYGRSKLAAEEYILRHLDKRENSATGSYKKAENQQSRRIIILRPVMIHGAGNKGNLNLLFRMVRRGIPWPLGAFSNQRSFCSIDNVAFVVKKLIQNPVPSGVYNLADDEVVSTNELIRLIAESLSRNARILKLPRTLMRLLARVGDLLPLPLNSKRLSKLTGSLVVSNEKLKKALGIERMPVSIRDGFSETLRSFRK